MIYLEANGVPADMTAVGDDGVGVTRDLEGGIKSGP
jgi:hypothetical protein